MIKNLRMFLVIILCFLFSVVNTYACKSKTVLFSLVNNRFSLEYHEKNNQTISFKLASGDLPDNYRLFINKEFVNASYSFFYSNDNEVLKFIDNLFKWIPWGQQMPYNNGMLELKPGFNISINTLMSNLMKFISRNKLKKV